MLDSAVKLSLIRKLNSDVTYRTQPLCFAVRSARRATTGPPMTVVAAVRVEEGSGAVNWTTLAPCSATAGPASQDAAARSKVPLRDRIRRYDCEIEGATARSKARMRDRRCDYEIEGTTARSKVRRE